MLNNASRGAQQHRQEQQHSYDQYYDEDDQYDNESEQDGIKDAKESVDRSKKSNKINIWGNSSSMNITPYLYKKILSSPYFKSLYEYKTYHEVLDLIKNIKYIHPFTDGESGGSPSIAFTLLFKLHTLKLSYKQLNGMLFQKESSTMEKAMALLYVRFAVQPEEMWNYFKDFVNDENSSINIYTKRITLGEFVRSLITNQKLFGSHCILPMIPAVHVRKMEESDEFNQANQKNKRKYYDNKDYSNSRQSDHSARKKQKPETTQQPSASSSTSSKEKEQDFEPAASRFSKPTFAKTNTSQSDYSKKYGAISKEYKTTNTFSKKDITEVETIRLSKE